MGNPQETKKKKNHNYICNLNFNQLFDYVCNQDGNKGPNQIPLASTCAILHTYSKNQIQY